MGSRILRALLLAALLGGLGFVAWKVWERLGEEGRAPEAHVQPPAPVEVAPVRHGRIVQRRTFSGSLEAPASFVVAPKISGRIDRLEVDIADPVRRGATVAWLDDEERVQAERQAEAEHAVAEANHRAAESALLIADRELERIRKLNERGVSSDTELDQARADQLAKKAEVDVAAAQVERAESEVAAARIRLGYTRVVARWRGGDDERVVGERFVSEGATVEANAPLLRIVELDPITAVIHVVERDYGRIQPGQAATLVTDALPGVEITGEVVRVAPVFRSTTRQARVELRVENPTHRLKPGMFVRATLALAEREDAVIVPRAALTKRADRPGVFVVDEEALRVRWCPVTVGIHEGDEVAVEPDPIAGESLPALTGRVVTLGQELVSDGAPIAIPGDEEAKSVAPGDAGDRDAKPRSGGGGAGAE